MSYLPLLLKIYPRLWHLSTRNFSYAPEQLEAFFLVEKFNKFSIKLPVYYIRKQEIQNLHKKWMKKQLIRWTVRNAFFSILITTLTNPIHKNSPSKILLISAIFNLGIILCDHPYNDYHFPIESYTDQIYYNDGKD